MIIERMKETRPGETICLSYEECYEVLRRVDDLEERVAIISEGGWHDAEKNPPKKSGKYFVFDENEGILQLEYDECIDDERWGFWEEYFDMETLGSMGSDWKPYPLKVLYWMIMPEPPKEGDQE